jgi:hypothetical protein
MKKHYQQLLIPLTIWSGLEQGFFGADFTAVSRHFVLETKLRGVKNYFLICELYWMVTHIIVFHGGFRVLNELKAFHLTNSHK